MSLSYLNLHIYTQRFVHLMILVPVAILKIIMVIKLVSNVIGCMCLHVLVFLCVPIYR